MRKRENITQLILTFLISFLLFGSMIPNDVSGATILISPASYTYAANGAHGPTELIANAFDGNRGTQWDSNEYPGIVYINFSSLTRVDFIYLLGTTLYTMFTYQTYVNITVNDITWLNAWNGNFSLYSDGDVYKATEFFIPIGVSLLKIKITVLSGSYSGGAGFSEIGVISGEYSSGNYLLNTANLATVKKLFDWMGDIYNGTIASKGFISTNISERCAYEIMYYYFLYELTNNVTYYNKLVNRAQFMYSKFYVWNGTQTGCYINEPYVNATGKIGTNANWHGTNLGIASLGMYLAYLETDNATYLDMLNKTKDWILSGYNPTTHVWNYKGAYTVATGLWANTTDDLDDPADFYYFYELIIPLILYKQIIGANATITNVLSYFNDPVNNFDEMSWRVHHFGVGHNLEMWAYLWDMGNHSAEFNYRINESLNIAACPVDLSYILSSSVKYNGFMIPQIIWAESMMMKSGALTNEAYWNQLMWESLDALFRYDFTNSRPYMGFNTTLKTDTYDWDVFYMAMAIMTYNNYFCRGPVLMLENYNYYAYATGPVSIQKPSGWYGVQVHDNTTDTIVASTITGGRIVFSVTNYHEYYFTQTYAPPETPIQHLTNVVMPELITLLIWAFYIMIIISVLTAIFFVISKKH